VSAELEHIWSRVQGELAQAVGESTYRLWLEPLEPLELGGEALVVAAPDHAARWVQHRFGRLLATCAQRALGPSATIEVVSAAARGSQPHSAGWAGSSAQPRAGHHRHGPVAPVPARAESGALGNPKLTFDHFVIGDSNRLAHAAALTVAEMPAQAYNPLFLCGPPGVGKTHLLSSIANLMLIHSPSLCVRMTTGEAFTNAFLGALSDGHTEAFKARFRDVDVLLVDDVQFLERKARTEEEFFHTFNALYDSGRQVVLSSDRPPADLQALEDRLRERFQCGLVADIKPPEPSTRLAILRKRAQHDGIPLGDASALELIASRVDTNVRALEGALIRVVAYGSLTGRQVTAELAAEVLDNLYPQRTSSSRPRTIGEIQAAACAHFGLTEAELLSAARSARIAWPRQLAMYLARELTGESLPAIGRQFGGRDHTTVLHACRRAGERVRTDPGAQAAVEKLRLQLGIEPT
jgi:chromosomal replication initiator protein